MNSSRAEKWKGDPILFFDGECNLCNSAVDLVIRVDRSETIHFASLQSPWSETFFASREEPKPNLSSMVFFSEGCFYYASDAAIQIGAKLKFPWNSVSLGRYFPRSWRESIYRLVARNRYRWFGKRETCRIPTESEAKRLIA